MTPEARSLCARVLWRNRSEGRAGAWLEVVLLASRGDSGRVVGPPLWGVAAGRKVLEWMIDYVSGDEPWQRELLESLQWCIDDKLDPVNLAYEAVHGEPLWGLVVCRSCNGSGLGRSWENDTSCYDCRGMGTRG